MPSLFVPLPTYAEEHPKRFSCSRFERTRAVRHPIHNLWSTHPVARCESLQPARQEGSVQRRKDQGCRLRRSRGDHHVVQVKDRIVRVRQAQLQGHFAGRQPEAGEVITPGEGVEAVVSPQRSFRSSQLPTGSSHRFTVRSMYSPDRLPSGGVICRCIGEAL